MSIFATEFPVKTDIDKAKFAAAAIAWLRGITRSTVLNNSDAKELHDDEAWLESPNGETLSLKTYESEQEFVIGVRHEIPDFFGRRWRTECVYSRFSHEAFLRVRGQCVATHPGAEVTTPLKPHFISQAIEDQWATPDGLFSTSSSPIELQENDLDLAASIMLGQASSFLPSIYVSRDNMNNLQIDAEYLAKKLTGICHVIVEPSRSFSFDLMNCAERRNPYAGAIGLFLPDGSEVGRFRKRVSHPKGVSLSDYCVTRVSQLVSEMAPRRGWEWQQLQEAQARKLRQKIAEIDSDSLNNYIEQFDSELQAKDERIQELELRLDIAKQKTADLAISTDQILPQELVRNIGRELYEGEFSDRLRQFLAAAIHLAGDTVHERTAQFAQKLLDHTHYSGRAVGLIHQIKGAAKDGNEMPRQLGALLSSFEFSKSSQNKHHKFDPPAELFGITSEVLPSTPSDSQRGGKNRGAEIIRNFGLNDLK